MDLGSLDPVARRERVLVIVKESLGKVLRLAPERIGDRDRINELGIDSLMALELKYALEYRLGVGVSTPELLKGPAVSELIDLILSSAVAAEIVQT